MSELYGDGSMDPFIRKALDRAEVVRDIYLRVSKVERAPGWLPLSVICEDCGRIGTTLATDWDGETVAYECQPDYVAWATGCGHSGRVVPAGGRAKLPFNVDWAAKWSHFGITIEGCGKDLGTKGGSRDRSDAISREVFDREPPLNVRLRVPQRGRPQDVHVQGRGRGRPRDGRPAAARAASASCSCATSPRRRSTSIPVATPSPGSSTSSTDWPRPWTGRPVRGELPADYERIFRLSLVDPDADVAAEAARFRPAFRHLTMLVQVPGVDLEARMAAEKGAPLDDVEKAILAERAEVARTWLDGCAPERYQVAVRDDLPGEVAALTEVQGLFLADLATGAAAEHPDGGDAWQDLIYRSGQARGDVLARCLRGRLCCVARSQPTAPARAGCWPASKQPFVVERLPAAAAAVAGSQCRPTSRRGR